MFGIKEDLKQLMEQAYDPLYNDKEPLDIIEIGGVKYKRIEEPQSFYDKLRGLLKTKLGDSVECDEMVDRVRDLIREHIPPLIKNKLSSSNICGYNQAIKAINRSLFNDIQQRN